MPKRSKPTKTPKRLVKANIPAVDLVDELIAATEILSKQRANDQADVEYAFVVSTPFARKQIKDINDEFTREFKFQDQAKDAIEQVLPKLKELGIPTEIPKTYIGDFIKTQRQMDKIRDNLKFKKDSNEKSEKMKKLRELKKVGKKIQEEVLRKRSKDKKDFLEKVKKKPVAELFDD